MYIYSKQQLILANATLEMMQLLQKILFHYYKTALKYTVDLDKNLHK